MSTDIEKKQVVTATTVRSEPASTDSPDAGNIDKVRDILFGSQVRDIEKKLSRMKDEMAHEITAIRDDARQQFEALEGYIKKELETLSEQLKAEHDLLNKTARDLREDMLEQSKALTEEIRKKNSETQAILDQRANELREDKVDRSALSKHFTEMAIHLSEELANELHSEPEDGANE